MTDTGPLDPAERRRRREFIRAHHPDIGGNPEVFQRGLHAFDRTGTAGPPVVAVRSPWPPLGVVLVRWRRRRQRRAAPRVQ